MLHDQELHIVNTLLEYLSNIHNHDDALQFVRIALDAVENLCDETGDIFNRNRLIQLITATDSRIYDITLR